MFSSWLLPLISLLSWEHCGLSVLSRKSRYAFPLNQEVGKLINQLYEQQQSIYLLKFLIYQSWEEAGTWKSRMYNRTHLGTHLRSQRALQSDTIFSLPVKCFIAPNNIQNKAPSEQVKYVMGKLSLQTSLSGCQQPQRTSQTPRLLHSCLCIVPDFLLWHYFHSDNMSLKLAILLACLVLQVMKQSSWYAVLSVPSLVPCVYYHVIRFLA